ncbi:MAG: hypothetical protein Q4E89_09140 [Eubacteriales bacterium]|nr:hypothetical protein [Eubacteriales bacterium]
MNRNINIITDLNGNKLVLINDIIFKGRKYYLNGKYRFYRKRFGIPGLLRIKGKR